MVIKYKSVKEKSSVKDAQAIEKLNSTNFSIWKFKIEMLLIKEDLFEIITEEPPNPITTDWSKKDRKARAIINLSIADDQIDLSKHQL